MATGCRSIALGLASMLAVSCQTTRDLTTPGSGMTARVVASDASRPVGPDGRPVSVTGTATFTGLTVELWDGQDRKSTRLNSSHVRISYAVFCLKKKKRLVCRHDHKI